MKPRIFHHPGTLDYNFGPSHPLKPERMRRTLGLLEFYGVVPETPGLAKEADVLRVHSEDYVEAVRRVDHSLNDGAEPLDRTALQRFGFYGDNPPFAGMYAASLAYTGSVVAATQAVLDGAPIGIALDGGLHHAQRGKASGFCIFDDPAVALSMLLDRFDRVAYVDIDVHHGDGVQWIWFEDPRVLTCSIHEEGRTLFPGTGGLEEVGADWTSLNVPMAAKTTADVWLDAFERTILPALDRFQPQAIVLQMGTDIHFLDPLGHLLGTQHAWLGAIEHIRRLNLPLVAVGGGGYNLSTVPRMWTSAALTLLGLDFDDAIPEPFASQWGVNRFSDSDLPFAKGGGKSHAESVVDFIRLHHLPNLG